jgi:two-component system response regulator
MMPSTKKTILVALIEDDPNDVFLFQRALTRGGFAWPLINFKDGREAVDYFKPLESTITPSPRLPDIILTDIKMPRLDGIAFLHWLRGEPELNDLPVIVLTSSVLPSDMDQAHRLGIFDFITKEATYENVVPALERFLGSLNKDSGSSKPVGAVMNSRPQLL